MEIQDGFIVGVFNYCDRWCETCRFTSHCRLFADKALYEASQDANFKALADAPPLPEEIPPPPSREMQEFFDELNEAAEQPLTPEELKLVDPRPSASHQHMIDRAKAYGFRAIDWLAAQPEAERSGSDQAPINVIGWFSIFISAKIHRAACSLATFDSDDEFPADHDGSAKAALDGIDRSHAAWLALIEAGSVSEREAHPFVVDLVWLGEALEREFPKARDFIRPGFDEPEGPQAGQA
jgi:hypothetical protein